MIHSSPYLNCLMVGLTGYLIHLEVNGEVDKKKDSFHLYGEYCSQPIGP